jgi:hypothetical protein
VAIPSSTISAIRSRRSALGRSPRNRRARRSSSVRSRASTWASSSADTPARRITSSFTTRARTLADRTHGELGLERHAELAHDDHVERGVERPRDLGRHRHTAARQTQHDGRLVAEVVQPGGEAPAGVDSISEVHGVLPGVVDARLTGATACAPGPTGPARTSGPERTLATDAASIETTIDGARPASPARRTRS